MKTNKRLYFGLVAFLSAMLLALAACSSASTGSDAAEAPAEGAAEASTGGETIALNMFFRRDEWWQDLEKTALETAAANNLKLLVQDADADNAKQLQQLETFVTQNVSSIIYAPIDTVATKDIVADAHEKGISIVCIELCLDDLTNVDAWAQFDQRKAGYDLGVMAGEFLNEKYDGQGKVAVIWDPTNQVQQLRYDGWKEGLAATAPNAEYVAEQNGENNRDKTMSITENILTANPDTVIWFPVVEEMAFGVIAALDAKGVDPATVGVYAEGWGQETLENMAGAKPFMKGAIITPSTTLAREAVQAVADHLHSGTAFTKDMRLATDIVTPENAVEYFKSRGFTLP